MSRYEVGNRPIVFEASFGSLNYNLNTLASDSDYKVFVCPTFDDLYQNVRFSTSVVTETFDYDVHDIRQLGELFWRTNINFMEVLFAKDSTIYGPFDDLYFWMECHREELARMNLPYLYEACVGMHKQKLKRMWGKGTASTRHLVESFGYECKEASHAYRVLDCLQRYYENGFTSFKKAICYADDDYNRTTILDMKCGRIFSTTAEDLLRTKLSYVSGLKEHFQRSPDSLLRAELECKIKEAVRNVINGNK